MREHIHFAVSNKPIAIRAELLNCDIDMFVSDRMVRIDQIGVSKRNGMDDARGDSAACIKEECKEDIVVQFAPGRNGTVEVNIFASRPSDGSLLSLSWTRW